MQGNGVFLKAEDGNPARNGYISYINNIGSHEGRKGESLKTETNLELQ